MEKFIRLMRAAAMAASLLASALAFAGPIVTLGQGTIEGIAGANYHLFRNIPYAQPPVGDLRWKAPLPAGGRRLSRNVLPSCSPCSESAEIRDLVEYAFGLCR